MLLLTLFCAHYAQAQSVNKSRFGKGLQFIAADSSFSLKFSTRFQTLYQTIKSEGSDDWNDRMMIRRARLKFDGFVYSPKIEYKIELGLSNRDIGSDNLDQFNNADNIILDAVAKWQMTPTLALWAGQTKLPGNRERVVSSQKLQLVDRSLLNSEFNLDRDIGLQLHNEHQIGGVVLREIGAVSMGEGRDVTSVNEGGYGYTARVEVLPFGNFESEGDYVGGDLAREETPKLSLAASYDFNDNATRSRGQLGSFLSGQRDLRTWFVDAMFKYEGFSAMAEYADRKAADASPVVSYDGNSVDETFVTGEAFNVQAGYLLQSNWEVAGRYTTFDPTNVTGINNEKQYTFGLSKYIVGHSLKVQGDATLIREQNRADSYMFRLQMEVAL